jgi:hypothetical protein
MEEVTETPAKKRRLAALPEGHAGDGGPGTAAKPLTDRGEGAAGEQHGLCEEEVQLRVRVQNSADAVVVRVRPEKVDLTGHRGLVELPEKMRRCAVHVRELAVASSALETLPEWLGELARLEVLRLGHATFLEEWVGYGWERKREGCDRLTGLPEGLSALKALTNKAFSEVEEAISKHYEKAAAEKKAKAPRGSRKSGRTSASAA